MSEVKKTIIEQDIPDDHVFIMITCPDRPTISIDISNVHGRRAMSTRVAGMTVNNCLVDITHLEPISEELHRYCPLCGEEIDLVSSKTHRCKDD